MTRQEGTYRKTGQNRTEISETSRRNRSPRGDGPYPWFGAAAWRPAAGGRRRGTRAPAPGWLGLEETCGGPARGQVGTRKRGEFLVIFFLAELAKSTSNNRRNAGCDLLFLTGKRKRSRKRATRRRRPRRSLAPATLSSPPTQSLSPMCA